MNNQVYLLSLTISGIKSIRNNLHLEFYKKTVNKSFDPLNHRIKAIYGENGCGKTAVITAVQILKDMISDRSCLKMKNYQVFLKDVINKHDQKLCLECEFYYYTEPSDQVYHYTIEVAKNSSGDYGISFEELTYRKADYPASKVNVAFNDLQDIGATGSDSSDSASDHMAALAKLGASLCTNIMTKPEAGNGMHSWPTDELMRLTGFIKVLKPDLVSITDGSESADDDNSYGLVLHYGDYQISYLKEGRGIQNLINLWPCLRAVEGAGIVFIDGFERDINEVIFERIIRYFARYGKGQLCFTCSNTAPMQELRKYKNSIDFLSSDGKVTHWRRSGNFSPDSLYKNGMIENLPFNIEAEDFLGLL